MQKSLTQRVPQTKWIEVPQNLKLGIPYILATPLRPTGAETVQYQAITQRGPIKLQIPNNSTFLVSNGQIYDDMCDMDILNQPEILNNLIERYKNGKIFTFIGPTLIVVNPYRIIPEFFSNDTMMRIRDKILNGSTSTEKPHIYLIAGNAYTSMIDQQKKQAIVISGESGAGKTQSTKYCMQILTSLSHKQSLPIQAKILACNPLLEAFGNSKTIRNDNSSRFGKYVQIYFSSDNTIAGASINSYLLEKSRVVAAAQKQRTFHIFYALIASELFPLEKPSYYNYLSKSKCYEAAGIDDKAYFDEIKKSMKSIGFTQAEQNKIWQLLITILQLGNIQFDDNAHKEHESNPCSVKNKKQMEKIAKNLSINEGELQKILLFEKKKFLKQYTLSPYNKNKCIANVNTLSKAIYNVIFQFILFKIQKSLKPQKNISNYIPINILDIFGFENFQHNSFEQFCINFTNEKLLKLYNKYVFEREMEILKEDGLMEQIENIKSPTNDYVIEIISGKLSMFSIINDFTMPQQFKDNDIMEGFENKLSKCTVLKFDKIHKNNFIIIHSQCNVKYSIEGFKQKNQDKVIPEIADIVTNLFQHESKEQSGKTLLGKFSTEIDDLMNELNSSCVHFIRCIKPNEKKISNLTEQQYIINQIRYLGVFETIQIRKQTFPSRWIYEEFLERFEALFEPSKGSAKTRAQKIMQHLTKNKQEYLLGNQRVYMNSELQNKLSIKLHQYLKKKYEGVKKIWRSYKRYRLRKQIKEHLKVLVKRIRLWKIICAKEVIKIQKTGFQAVKTVSEKKKEEQKALMNKKLMQTKQKREEEQKKLKQLKQSSRNQNLMKCSQLFSNKILETKKEVFHKLKSSPQPTKNYETTNKKPTYESVNNQLYDSQLNESVVFDTGELYQRQIEDFNTKYDSKKSIQFNQSFLLDKTMIVGEENDVLYPGYIKVAPFDIKQSPNFQKLKLVLSEKYQIQYTESEEDFFSPPSDDSKFQLEDLDPEMMNKVINFDSKDFFKRVLRKRTNFIGMEKDEDDILVCKTKPLSKSLTLINENDNKCAIKIFKHLLKIIEQAKLDAVFKLIENLIMECQNTSPQIKNQVFLQLIRQSNSQVQIASVRIIQAMAVFLHIFHPDKDFLYAGLQFFFKRLAEHRYTDKQNQYVRYIFKKIARKIEKPYVMYYMPIKYQLMALMCKRKISMPIYLPVGSSILIRVQSYETFGDIKTRVMDQLGINHKRLSAELFSFWEVVNFDNAELEENPLDQNTCAWDIVSYWEKAKQKYKQKGINPPVFFCMIKIRYLYQCHRDDEQTIEIMFAQAYFEYFIGRMIFKDLKDLGALAGIIKKIKFSKTAPDDHKGSYPSWVYRKYKEKQLIDEMVKNVNAIQKQNLSILDLKFLFISIALKCPTCLSFVIPTTQRNRLCLRPNKMTLVDSKLQIISQTPIKSISRFTNDHNKFLYNIRNDPEKKSVPTEYASTCTRYLQRLPHLISNSKQKVKIASNSILQ